MGWTFRTAPPSRHCLRKPQYISAHPRFQDDGRPGTLAQRNESQQSRLHHSFTGSLGQRNVAAIERRGVWGGKNGTLFPHLPEITKEVEAASDHAAVWVDLDIA